VRLRCPANDRRRAAAARRRAGGAICLFAAALLAACEHPVPSPPPPAAPLVRPVVTLAARGTEARLMLPTAAVVTRGGIPGVFVLQEAAAFPPPARGEDGRALPEARFRMVKTGKTSGNRVEILSGLGGDETLVLGALSNVHDGSPVKFVNREQ
jgi:multidrug efflux pump subunit AcrA (membrane-fusion protein)